MDALTPAESVAEAPNQVSAEAARRRTFAIIAHPDAGKTTLTEKLLLRGGAIQLAGAVRAKGNARRTRSDWMKIEQDRGISVATSVMTFERGGLVFNLLLAGLPSNDPYTVGWASDVFHRVIPLYVVLDWVLFADRDRQPWRRLWQFLAFPLIWVVVVLARGADWFRTMGTDESPGTVVVTVVGDVVAPDVGEVELGTALGAVIDGVGSGVHPGRRIKAVFSGVASRSL